MKIGHKLILGFIGIALLIVGIGYISLYTCQKALQKTIGADAVSLAAEAIDKIDRSIYSKIEKFQIYASHLNIQKAAKQSNEEFEKLDDIKGFIKQRDKNWASVPKESTTAFMQELINNELAEELKAQVEFYERKHGYRVLGEIFVTNKYGANISQTRKTTDYYQADEEWWLAAKVNGLYVGDVSYDESADIYTTIIGIRLEDKDENFIGVMKIAQNIDEAINIIKELEEQKISKDHTKISFKLLTKNGRLIYSTKPYEFYEDLSDEEFVIKTRKTESGHFRLKVSEPDKKEELLAHARSKGYRNYKGLGWILIVERDLEQIYSPIASLRNTILVVSLIVVALAMLACLFIYQAFSVPITKLTKATVEVRKGNLDTEIEIKSKDEIGQLAASFQNMTEDLRTTISNLKKEITERKRSEQALIESEEKFRYLAEQSPNMIFINKNGSVVYANQKCEEVMNYKREEFYYPDFKFLNLIAPECRDIIQADFDRQMKGQDVPSTESALITKEGKRIDAIISTRLIRYHGENAILGTVTDITERKQIEQALRNSECRYRTFLKNIPQKIFYKDLDSVYVLCNESYARDLNINPDEIKGRTDYDFFPKEIADKYRADDKKIVQSGKSQQIEEKYIKNGQEFTVNTFKAPVIDESDNVIGVFGVFWDITAHKRAEDDLEKLNEELESTVQELSRSNQKLKDFAYMAAHDLKTPLRGIVTLANWISADYADKFDEQGREKVNMLAARAERTIKLIDGVLEYSNITRHKYKEKQVDLNKLLKNNGVIEIFMISEVKSILKILQ